jgi:hypothetical protein
MFRSPIGRAATVLGFFGAIACSDDARDGAGTGGTGPNTVSCTDDPRLDVYTDDMQKEGELGELGFRFSDFVPAPPAKGSNTFHVQMTDAAGAVVTDGLEVDLIMPDHGHGTSIEPVISLESASGIYSVTPLFLFMPGVWRITFGTSSGADGAAVVDRVALHFCIEG